MMSNAYNRDDGTSVVGCQQQSAGTFSRGAGRHRPVNSHKCNMEHYLLAIDIYQVSILYWLPAALRPARRKRGTHSPWIVVKRLKSLWETEGILHGKATHSHGHRFRCSYRNLKSICSNRAPPARKSRGNRRTCPRALASQRLSERITRRRLVPGEASTGAAIRTAEDEVA